MTHKDKTLLTDSLIIFYWSFKITSVCFCVTCSSNSIISIELHSPFTEHHRSIDVHIVIITVIQQSSGQHFCWIFSIFAECWIFNIFAECWIFSIFAECWIFSKNAEYSAFLLSTKRNPGVYCYRGDDSHLTPTSKTPANVRAHDVILTWCSYLMTRPHITRSSSGVSRVDTEVHLMFLKMTETIIVLHNVFSFFWYLKYI